MERYIPAQPYVDVYETNILYPTLIPQRKDH